MKHDFFSIYLVFYNPVYGVRPFGHRIYFASGCLQRLLQQNFSLEFSKSFSKDFQISSKFPPQILPEISLEIPSEIFPKKYSYKKFSTDFFRNCSMCFFPKLLQWFLEKFFHRFFNKVLQEPLQVDIHGFLLKLRQGFL